MRISSLLLVFALFAACSDAPAAKGGGVQVYMDFRRETGFYSAPFPSDDRQADDGRIDIAGFPNPDNIGFVEQTLEVIREDVRGFGIASGIFFTMSAPPDAVRLPDAFASVADGAPVFLISVTPEATDYLRRYPVDVSFAADGGPFGAPNLLSLIPVQGMALRSKTTYAAVVLRDLRGADGKPLGVSGGMAALVEGRRPAGLSDAAFARYRAALGALAEAGVKGGSIAGLAVFTTGEPASELGLFREAILDLPRPKVESAFALTDTYSTFCVYRSTVQMPVYQKGKPPFDSDGGNWTLDANGKPALQGYEQAKFIVTIPRATAPAGGYPTVVMVRTGGDPLVDRGVHPVAHGGGTPGSGPAGEFAKEGYAGVTVDGPHGGLRNVTKGDEQVLMFNILNPRAMRDNVRQSALETILLAHMLDDVTIDASGCPGAGGTVKLDTQQLALMGHSMGATVAQPAMAYEPRFKALILSGGGASWLANLVHKQKPLNVPQVAELVLNYGKYRRKLTEQDPVVSLTQWAGDPSDAPAYNQMMTERNVLMLQGIVDHYIMPPIANASSLSLGLDLAGDPLDAETAELASLRPLEPLLAFSGRERVKYPVQGNHGKATAVVVQHVEDGIEDGHEVVFQTEAPKLQYRCFLRSLLLGAPVVDEPGKCRF